MPYLDTYTTPLTAATAAHLLRRATFGPTQQEITDFTGKTAAQAVGLLMSNVSYTLSPTPPLELDETKPNAGLTFVGRPFDQTRNYAFGQFTKYWWLGLMTDQNGHPSVLEKLAVFWQNHFVTRFTVVEDYRYTYRYLQLLRTNALGNFRTLVTEITKDPSMLIFQNGNLNQKGTPNENYAREMQELFVVGVKDFNGNPNYTEDDVKAVAKVLTGWECTNHTNVGSISIDPVFTPSRHDTTNKVFSSHYNNTTITGRSGANAGNDELNDLVTMLLNHSHTPKFICRKLYRWYVNTTVTQTIEDNVIVPLANFFSSAQNNYAIQPVLEKLLSSQIFYDEQNRGVIIKSPIDIVVGTLRYFNQPIPNPATEFLPFRKITEFQLSSIVDMQMNILDQPTVFGFTPYYQTGYSKNWINASTISIRNYYADVLIYGSLMIKPDYRLGLNLIAMAKALQPNFPDLGTASITCLEVLDGFTKNLLATELAPAHKDYILDHIMMTDQPRSDWTYNWDLYRKDPTNAAVENGVRWRCELLMRYVLRMAEYNVF